MAFKTIAYKVRGMKQDISESAFDSDYAFENMNIRIDNRNNNTLLSIEQEMGNKTIGTIQVYGKLDYSSTLHTSIDILPFTVLGHCEIDKYIVLFGKGELGDYIARLEYYYDENTNTSSWRLVYIFKEANLNFNLNNPIETLGCVETEQMVKVYFVDGLSPLRKVNVVSEEQVNNVSLLQASLVNGTELFTVEKDWERQGHYLHGKVQFAFNYETDLEVKTNLIEITPLFDCTNKMSCYEDSTNLYAEHSFRFNLKNLDTSFKWVNIYIFFWSSDGDPIIKNLKYLIPESGELLNKELDYDGDIVSDYTGTIIDLMQTTTNLIPLTLAAKDNFLFLGNIRLGTPQLDLTIGEDDCIANFELKTIGKEYFIKDGESITYDVMTYNPFDTTYKSSNYEYMGFRRGNWYKFGIIAQHRTGVWSNVIPLYSDFCCDINSKTESVNENNTNIYSLYKIPRFHLTLKQSFISQLQQLGYVKVKPVCVVPTPELRTVLTQGIACPTLYKGGDRINSKNEGYSKFSFGSYFFRPYSQSLNLLEFKNNSFHPKYSYTLRDVNDLIEPGNLWDSTTTLGNNQPAIKTNVDYDDTSDGLFNLNNPYREFRHGFSLPPKNTINAELESSNISLNEFYWNSNKYNNSELCINDLSGIGNYDIQNLKDVTKFIHIGSYEKTLFVDSTINTLNSPEVDYGYYSELNYGIHSVIDFLNTSRVDICGYSQITGSYSGFDVESKKFSQIYDLYSVNNHQCEYAEGYNKGRVITDILPAENEDITEICDVLLKRNTNSKSVISPTSGPFWIDNKLVLRTRTKMKNHLTNDTHWNLGAHLHANATTNDQPLQDNQMSLGIYVGGYTQAYEGPNKPINDYYIIPTDNVEDRSFNKVIYGYRDPMTIDPNDDGYINDKLSVDYIGRIVTSSWNGELMSTKTRKIVYKDRSILTVKFNNKEYPYFVTDIRLNCTVFPNINNNNKHISLSANNTYFTILGVTQNTNMYNDAGSNDYHNRWSVYPLHTFYLALNELTWSSRMWPDSSSYTHCGTYDGMFWISCGPYYRLISNGIFNNAYYFDYYDPSLFYNPNVQKIYIAYCDQFNNTDESALVPRVAIRPWILPYNSETINNSFTYDNSTTVNVGYYNYLIATPNKYGAHLYMPFSTTFPHAVFDPYYAHSLYPFMHNNDNYPFIGTTECFFEDKQNSGGNIGNWNSYLRPSYNKTVSFLYSTVTNYFDTPVQFDTKQGYYNVDIGNESLKLNLANKYTEDVFYNNPKQVRIDYQTQSLTAAMKWYRGFSTLKVSNDEKLLCLGSPLNKKSIFGNLTFSGQLPQLFSKNGGIGTFEFNGVDYYKQGSDNAQSVVANYMFAEKPCNIEFNYNLTPHLIFYTQDLNYTLPNSSVLNQVNDKQFSPELYYKKFQNENIQTQEPLYDSTTAQLRIISGLPTPYYAQNYINKTIYPHTGTWRNINVDNINYSSNPYWYNNNDFTGDYNIIETTTINNNINNDYIVNENNTIKTNTRTQEDCWFLNIVNLINTNITENESPYNNDNLQLYDWKECGYSHTLVGITGDIELNFDEGDTYFQRYNCVKTYLNDQNVKNDIAETASVMIESYINLDAIKYDNVYGTQTFRSLNPYNAPHKENIMNLLNPVYSKQNTLITHHQVNFNYTSSTLAHYPTMIMWSSQKIFGSEEDHWLLFPGNNTYYASGNYGAINKLTTFRDQVYCLQEHGFSQLDFNSKALIDTDSANPISITSIEGTRLTHNTYLSNNIGTQNKWSVLTSKYGIYFVDDTLQSIYRFSQDGLDDLSVQHSFKTWTKQNTTTKNSVWSVNKFLSGNCINLTTSYDLTHNDVYFTNSNYCLCFSESLNSFTSFYSYNNIPYMFSYKDNFYALSNNITTSLLYQNHANYTKLLFENTFESYVELLINSDLVYDKVFNFIEYNNDVYTFDGHLIPNVTSYNYIRVYNEYQDSSEIQTDMLSKQKFRLWRTQIPRHNFPYTRDRIRGAWCKIRLINRPQDTDIFKDQLHLISVNYSIPSQPLKQNFSEDE